MVEKKHIECTTRLGVGFLLNGVLWFVFRRASMWGGIEREFHVNLLSGCLAIVALVFVLPVFWKGASWQVPMALLLIALPSVVVFSVIHLLQKY